MVRSDLKNHPLFTLLAKVTREFLKDAASVKDGKLHYHHVATTRETYAIGVWKAMVEILYVCDQLYFAIDLLSRYRKNLAPAKMGRDDYLIFGIENYLLRYTSIHDRSLRLVNEIYELGLSNRECRSATIADNHHVKGTPVCFKLRSIEAAEEPFRKYRNQIAHYATYRDDKLNDLGVFLALEREGDEFANRHFFFYKTLTDRYVATKKREFRKGVDTMEQLVK